ncbi:hypothetical protein [Staphylococcus sp. 11261D007BR]
MLSQYRLIMFAFIVFILFQFYFAYYYLLGEGARTSSHILGWISFVFGFVLIIMMIGVRHYFKKHKS